MLSKIALSLLALIMPLSSFATQLTSSVKTSASISSFCQITAGNVDFGVLKLTQTNTASSQLSVLCTKGTVYNIAMNYHVQNQGTSNGVYFTGIMYGAKSGNTDWVNYGILYPNSTERWGSGSADASSISGNVAVKTYSDTGTGAVQTIPVTVQANTVENGSSFLYLTPDVYSDYVSVVVTY